jgi:hypothetical protein
VNRAELTPEEELGELARTRWGLVVALAIFLALIVIVMAAVWWVGSWRFV